MDHIIFLGNYTYCPANDWDQPEDAILGQKYICQKRDPPMPIPNTAPGDYCTNSTYCYGFAYGATCEKGKWVSAKKLGESCVTENFADELKCPENSYCTNDSKICVQTLKEGEDCSDYYKYCGFGTDCVGSEDGTSYRCSKFFKAPDGTRFRYDQMQGNNEIMGPRSYCASYNAYSISQQVMEWRPLIKSNDTTEAKLRRDEAGSLCYYTTYNDDNATYKNPIVKADLSVCGFNIDNYSWWNKRRGDPYYSSIYNKLSTLDLSKYTCHVDSLWRNCKSFADENKGNNLSF